MLNTKEIIQKIDIGSDYTIKEVAVIIGISLAAVSGQIKREHLKSRLIGGRHYVKGSDIIKYLTGE